MTIDQFLKQFEGLDPVTQRIKIFETVRDFPYQINGKRSPEELLDTKEGYCAAKHRLLKACYDKLGYETTLCFTPFTFRDIYLPEHLKGRGLANKKIYHTFLWMKMEERWITIDATFHTAMKDIYIVNIDRDGVSDQKDICPFSNVAMPKTAEEEKNLIAERSDEFDADDQRWIHEYNSWIKTFSLKKDGDLGGDTYSP